MAVYKGNHASKIYDRVEFPLASTDRERRTSTIVHVHPPMASALVTFGIGHGAEFPNMYPYTHFRNHKTVVSQLAGTALSQPGAASTPEIAELLSFPGRTLASTESDRPTTMASADLDPFAVSTADAIAIFLIIFFFVLIIAGVVVMCSRVWIGRSAPAGPNRRLSGGGVVVIAGGPTDFSSSAAEGIELTTSNSNEAPRAAGQITGTVAVEGQEDQGRDTEDATHLTLPRRKPLQKIIRYHASRPWKRTETSTRTRTS